MAVEPLTDYETRRLENIKRNQSLAQELGIQRANERAHKIKQRPLKRKRAVEIAPTRSSARVASSTSKPSYNEDEITRAQSVRRPAKKAARSTRAQEEEDTNGTAVKKMDVDSIASICAGWTSWTPSALPARRDPTTKVFAFASDPSFTPNKSPEEMLREGVFGGSYFRPLRSKTLDITVSDDWKELPQEWTRGLDVKASLTNPTYDAEVNKFKVKCGQSIEEWESAGWIAHEYDVRGWFQWYCRFFMGRRCEDDERQISRWRRCVGKSGRWRLALLRKYIKSGVREVFDDGEDEDAPEVSPVMHQTCLHWAYEVRQEDLDAFWGRPT